MAPRAAIDSKQGAADPSPTLPLSEVPSDGIAPQLNLHVSKRDLADAAARRPSGLPIHMSPTAWQQFVKTLGPSDEIREERLSINRVRIHTKYGCYELEQTATQRIDPFNKSPNFVTNCRW